MCAVLFAAGMGISYLLQRWKDKPIKLFEAARQEAAEGRLHIESVAVLKKIYRSVVLSVPRMLCVSGPHVLTSCMCANTASEHCYHCGFITEPMQNGCVPH